MIPSTFWTSIVLDKKQAFKIIGHVSIKNQQICKLYIYIYIWLPCDYWGSLAPYLGTIHHPLSLPSSLLDPSRSNMGAFFGDFGRADSLDKSWYFRKSGLCSVAGLRFIFVHHVKLNRFFHPGKLRITHVKKEEHLPNHLFFGFHLGGVFLKEKQKHTIIFFTTSNWPLNDPPVFFGSFKISGSKRHRFNRLSSCFLPWWFTTGRFTQTEKVYVDTQHHPKKTSQVILI